MSALGSSFWPTKIRLDYGQETVGVEAFSARGFNGCIRGPGKGNIGRNERIVSF